ncbi:SDR family NAD(P)-dependent oxidoreductase [Nocardia sp. NPDC052566]|uniref:SDR family NAD(P)-dependent oxidoreductase n=1 Tax=Nocardia sp. NPDC052566 TaxID=3364330 RepID=UPI0037CC5E32
MTTSTSADPVFAVIGATRGIGAATVAALAADPARRVVCCGRDRDAGAALAEKLGDRVDFVPADITDPAEVEHFFAAVAERGRLIGAFNCAGVIGTDTILRGSHFHEADPARFDDVMAVNVTALARCLRGELALMVEHGAGGAVVNCSSVAGLRAADSLSVSYTAAKHAVIGMTRALAVEYARHGIRVNAVCPGVIDTDMLGGLHDQLLAHLRAKNPSARIGTPAEVADTVEFLLSDRAAYISGTTVTIDAGGLSGAL